ncbi:hypothetical protein NKDENANG_00551 [Candidatus Entotheonellaceae bacterium PAL068K]
MPVMTEVKKNREMTSLYTPLWRLAGILTLCLAGAVQSHEHGGHAPHADAQAESQHHEPTHMTMEELHRHGGVPPGWKFTLPAGNSEAGRQVFIEMKCYTCHEVTGETFPAHKRGIGDPVGPNLTDMGMHHPAAYFAETIVNPNAVVILGEGYTGPDGLSRMPEYNDTLTIAQLIDLVAYLKSLRGQPMHSGASMHQHGGHDTGHHGSHQTGQHLPGMPRKPAPGH